MPARESGCQDADRRNTACLLGISSDPRLGGIETTRVKNEEFRLKIETYQEELAPAATQVFARVMGLRTRDITPSTDPQILALADRVDTLTEITTLVYEYMGTLLEAQGRTSIQLEQAIHLLEALTNRQEVTETQVAKIDERTQRLICRRPLSSDLVRLMRSNCG